MRYLFFIIIGYLSGSILYAYILPKYLKHMDITKLSTDKNPGAANAFMHAGIPIGILVIVCEILKGTIPVWLACRHTDQNSLFFTFIIIAPVLGHSYPLFFKGKKGGKAIAVSFGVLLGLYPDLTPVCMLAMLYIIFSLFVIVSPHLFRSITSFTVFGICIQLHTTVPLSIKLGCLLLSIIVVYRHFITYRGEQFYLQGPWMKFKKNG